MLIALQGFQGERPRVHPRGLGYAEAQVARNCKLWDGRLRPWARPSLEIAATKPGPLRSIYRYTDAPYWLHFNTDVDVVRSPLAGRDFLYWTGDGAPRFGTRETIAGVSPLVANAAAAQNFLLVRNALGFSPGDTVEIELDSGGKHTTTLTTVQLSLNRINLAVAVAAASSIGRVVSNVTRSYPHGSYLLGVPAPTAAAVAGISTVGTSGDVTGLVGGLGEATGETATANQTYSIDLANIDSSGDMIDFQIDADFNGKIMSVQTQRVSLKVYLDPAGDNELIYESANQATFQGPAAASPGGTSADFDPNWVYWEGNTPRLLPGAPASAFGGSEEITGDNADTRTLSFQYGPSAGPHTYRLVIEHTFIIAISLEWNYKLRLSARRNGEMGVILDTPDHGLREGDKVQFTGIVGTGTVSALNKGTLSVLRVDGAKVYVDTEAAGTYTEGGKWKQIWDEADLEARTYVYTYVVTVDGLDMEGAPSPATAIVDAGEGQRIQLSSFIDPTTLGDGRPYSAVRVYRSLTNSDGEALYLFAAQLAVDAPNLIDGKRGTELAEQLPSQLPGDPGSAWLPPPVDLKGITELPNGGFAGFRGNEVLFSEPGFPHAWPLKYRRQPRRTDTVIALGAFGSSLIVGTEGPPTIMTGSEPDTMIAEAVEGAYPNLSKRGTVDMGYAIAYPSKTGLVLTTIGSVDFVTYDLFTVDEWSALNPASFIATRYNNSYVAFYDNGKERAGFILDPKDPASTLTFLDIVANAVWTDPRTDEFYLVTVSPSGAEQIVRWDGDKGSVPIPYRWRSKEYTANRPTALSVVKVDAAAYPVVVNIYCDGERYDSVEVQSEEPERLSDQMGEGRKWEIEILGDHQVEALYAASTMQELTRYLSGSG